MDRGMEGGSIWDIWEVVRESSQRRMRRELGLAMSPKNAAAPRTLSATVVSARLPVYSLPDLNPVS